LGLARAGFYVEPTSAVAAAGLRRLAGAGTLPGPAVVVLTGSGLKAGAEIAELLPPSRSRPGARATPRGRAGGARRAGCGRPRRRSAGPAPRAADHTAPGPRTRPASRA